MSPTFNLKRAAVAFSDFGFLNDDDYRGRVLFPFLVDIVIAACLIIHY